MAKKDAAVANGNMMVPSAPPPSQIVSSGPLRGLAKVTDLDYSFVNMVSSGSDANEIMQALHENLAGVAPSAFDFTRIRVPAGGGLAWEVMNPETGEADATREFDAVIVYFNDQKAYWPKGLDEKDAIAGPAQCYSRDCRVGIGDPGILCAKCPFNQFGSAKGGTGRGKACKDSRFLFIMRPGSVLPELLPAPPKSLKAVRDYFLRVATSGASYWRVVTRFRLEKDKNAGGIEYSKISLAPVAFLDGKAMMAAKAYSDFVKQMLDVSPVRMEAGDVDSENDNAQTRQTQTPDVNPVDQM